MSEAEQILLNRVKFIGENEWTLLGCPDDVIKELEQIEKEARISELNRTKRTIAMGLSRDLMMLDIFDRIKELERGE